jgi:hypothetical protein
MRASKILSFVGGPMIVIGGFLLLILGGCAITVQKRNLTSPAHFTSLDDRSPYLKAHLPGGGVYVLDSWRVNEGLRMVSGQGVLLDATRRTVDEGWFDVPVDSVAIFETNVVQTSPAIGAMAVVTVASLAVSIYCLSNPKACFGSCPTFYAPGDSAPILQAEGFSASVAPALEATDVDALYRCRPRGPRLNVLMTNEALETHVVRHADLLLARRPPGGRVLATCDGRFWQARELLSPARCAGPEGDCRDLLVACDGRERCSAADSSYLGTRELIELEFRDVPEGRLGLLVAARHALLSTYLFYQGLAYLGEQAAPVLARAGAPGGRDGASVGELLGRIEVLVPDGRGGWVPVGEVGETGPLATNAHLLLLPALPPGHVVLRLRLTKGNWRLDQAALALLGEEVLPVRLPPSRVLRDGVEDPAALERLTDEARTLITLPGDRYTLVYELPPDPETCEPFLESRGYYLEWMREEWLAEENPGLAALLLGRPDLALRMLAPAFKEMEPDMESQFWGSRYAVVR